MLMDPCSVFFIAGGISLKTTDGIQPAMQRAVSEVALYLQAKVHALTYFLIL